MLPFGSSGGSWSSPANETETRDLGVSGVCTYVLRLQKSQNQSRDRVFRVCHVTTQFRESFAKFPETRVPGGATPYSVKIQTSWKFHSVLRVNFNGAAPYSVKILEVTQNLKKPLRAPGSPGIGPEFPGSSGKSTPGTTPCSSLTCCRAIVST